MTETGSSSASGTPRGETDTSMSTEPPVPTPDAGPSTATTTSSTSFKPKKPKFGGIEQVGSESWAVWTGGKPKTDFSELEDTSPSEIQPNQYRATSVSKQAKSQSYRRQGLDPKFSKGDDLLLFQTNVMSHLEDHGLDTITYIADPTDPTKNVSIVHHYGKFTRESARMDEPQVRVLASL